MKMINKVVHLYYLLLQFNIFFGTFWKNTSHWRKGLSHWKPTFFIPQIFIPLRLSADLFSFPTVSNPLPPSLSLHRIRKACLSNPNVAIRVLFLDLLTVFAVETWRFLLLLSARGFALRRFFQKFLPFFLG